MACVCRNPARCPVCNTPVRVPLSNLMSSGGGATLVDRFARRDTTSSREGLRRIGQGTGTCPSCGHSVVHNHSRACVSEALAGAGVPAAEREAMLAKITFPEG
jgi:hypothetical protein